MNKNKPNKKPKTPEQLFEAAIDKLMASGLAPATISLSNDMIPLNERLQEMYKQLYQTPTKYTNMIAIITYDIENNRIRRNIAKYLERKGLIRLQKSVFFANLPRKTILDIKDTLIKVNNLYTNTDSIIIIPVPNDFINKLNCIGKDLSIHLFLENKNTFFF